jgi:(p)ppGpp synthase/HD superfamily hydrolase
VEFDYCCHPKGGDAIVAFYKDGKAIIHHKLCKKAYEKIKAKEPMLYVEWSAAKLYKYRLIVGLQNKKGALAELLGKLSLLDLNVLSIELGIQSSESADYCRIEVESEESKKAVLEEKLAKKIKLIELVSLDDAYNNN